MICKSHPCKTHFKNRNEWYSSSMIITQMLLSFLWLSSDVPLDDSDFPPESDVLPGDTDVPFGDSDVPPDDSDVPPGDSNTTASSDKGKYVGVPQ